MSDLWSVPTVMLASATVIGVALLFGFAGAAAIETDIGQTFAAAVGALILLSGTLEVVRMIVQSRRRYVPR